MLPSLGGNGTEDSACLLEQVKANPNVRYDCCIDAAMSVIEGRWKCTILCLLFKEGPMRYAELQRRIGEISSRILSKQLKELEEDGMILRTVGTDRKISVTYSLSSKGMSVLPALAALAEWGARYQMMQVIVPTDSVSEKRTVGAVADRSWIPEPFHFHPIRMPIAVPGRELGLKPYALSAAWSVL